MASQHRLEMEVMTVQYRATIDAMTVQHREEIQVGRRDLKVQMKGYALVFSWCLFGEILVVHVYGIRVCTHLRHMLSA